VDSYFVTDHDLARARRDPEFREKLLASNLDYLLVALARLRASGSAEHPGPAEQIREGVQLAVKLADMLQKEDGRTPMS
jgi:hypothetical protein